MSHKARTKIQKLLANLDLSDSGGIEAALAAASGDDGLLGMGTNPNNAALDDLLISALASAGHPLKAKDSNGDSDTEDSKSDITQDTDVVSVKSSKRTCSFKISSHTQICLPCRALSGLPCDLVPGVSSSCTWSARCCS